MLLSMRSILVLAIIACGFTAADLATDQKKKCTFGCTRSNPKMRQAGCARKIGYNSQTKQDSWLVKKGNPTEGHPGYYNCLGTDATETVCCFNNKIVVPPNSILKGMVVDGTGEMTYENLCHISDPLLSTWGDPTDCR